MKSLSLVKGEWTVSCRSLFTTVSMYRFPFGQWRESLWTNTWEDVRVVDGSGSLGERRWPQSITTLDETKVRNGKSIRCPWSGDRYGLPTLNLFLFLFTFIVHHPSNHMIYWMSIRSVIRFRGRRTGTYDLLLFIFICIIYTHVYMYVRVCVSVCNGPRGWRSGVKLFEIS